MQIRKALITAAGRNQRTLPLQMLVDRDGTTRSALGVILAEALSAGIEEVGIVIHPGDQTVFSAAAGLHEQRLHFIEQTEPRGYGHAVWCGRNFTKDDPFLLMVGDHVSVSLTEASCARQLVTTASTQDAAVSAVQATHESKLPYFGAISGRRVPGNATLYEITEVLEKPTPTLAEERLVVPGLRSAHYLCFFGMHVLTPSVMALLDQSVAESTAVHLSPTLSELARQERYLALETLGRRYDLGARFGLLTAQLALSLAGRDREEVLAGLVELLAQRNA
ncbi:MAG: UTP--glucose-1-phosphate uridylyltransferase [Pedosphaera sp.]|nr:UTP--glucose-1-phosphate uridylyltransferase [Pedosphaera sp.]